MNSLERKKVLNAGFSRKLYLKNKAYRNYSYIVKGLVSHFDGKTTQLVLK